MSTDVWEDNNSMILAANPYLALEFSDILDITALLLTYTLVYSPEDF